MEAWEQAEERVARRMGVSVAEVEMGERMEVAVEREAGMQAGRMGGVVSAVQAEMAAVVRGE